MKRAIIITLLIFVFVLGAGCTEQDPDTMKDKITESTHLIDIESVEYTPEIKTVVITATLEGYSSSGFETYSVMGAGSIMEEAEKYPDLVENVVIDVKSSEYHGVIFRGNTGQGIAWGDLRRGDRKGSMELAGECFNEVSLK